MYLALSVKNAIIVCLLFHIGNDLFFSTNTEPGQPTYSLDRHYIIGLPVSNSYLDNPKIGKKWKVDNKRLM